MYLKSLEIQGFKSFPDKTVLTFDSGITAIVGPNGSGKSNVSDAVRWVLGEQSTKTLRGGKMEDVIFKGTESRKPMGFAQVSMILSNDDGALPMDESEVMVTRRYYRSGESEYYINRNQVRLKDIHELFMDTGLGQDGYSIIGQGRIDEILSVKSQDRREIFEEAAGISKYRHHKEEAERKLAHTEDNLLRVGDKISELELQIGPLKTQSENAQKYLILHDQLRELEVTSWLNRIDDIEADHSKLSESLDDARKLADGNKTEIETLYKRSEELTEEMQSIDIDLETNRSESEALETDCMEMESEIAVKKNSMNHNEESIKRVQQESIDRENQVAQLKESIQNTLEREKQLQSDYEKTVQDLDLLNETLQKRTESADNAADKLKELQAQRDVLSAQKSFEDSKISGIRSTVDALEERHKNTETQIRELKEQNEELNRQLKENKEAEKENAETIRSIGNMIRGYSMRNESRQKKYEEVSSQLMKERTRYETLTSRQSMLEEMEKDYEGYTNSVKLVMQRSDVGQLKNILGPVTSLIRVKNEYTVAIETALGPAMQNIVVLRQEDAKSAIELLKSRNAGRATFLPLDSIDGKELREPGIEREKGFKGIASQIVSYDAKYEKIFKYLLGRIVIIDNLDHGMAAAKKYGHRFRIVTLDGQVLNAGGSMTGGSANRNSGILTRKNELDKLVKEVSELGTVIDDLRKQSDAAKREYEKSQYEEEVAKGQLRNAEDEKLKIDSEKQHLEQQISASDNAIESSTKDLEQVGERITGLTKQQNESTSKIADYDAKLEELNTEIEKNSTQVEEFNQERNEFSESLVKLTEKAAAIEAEIRSGKASNEQLEELLAQLSGDYEERLKLVSDYEQKNNEIQASIEKLSELAAERRSTQNEKKTLIIELSGKRMSIEGERGRIDKEARERNDLQIGYERDTYNFEQKIERIEAEQQQLNDKLWEKYELTYNEALPLRKPVEDQAQHDAKMRELRGKINRLGTPNLGAIEEYARVSERYNYLTSQRDDVMKSKEELLHIVGDLTTEMKRIFTDEFKKINESFSQTFVEIFGGGKGQLELEDPDNILDCGIEIKVQLPGKRLETLSLLSGGERAFVAIALYFSIIRVRPTPFCILDEIDAALDEVNVARYAAYMKHLTEKTQFIVITHRRGTMEEADMLYGVAMRNKGIEEGVSKILSLRLADVEKTLNMKI